jgi:uncharacterized protein (DUF488 family)
VKKYKIAALVDVRLIPRSRANPQYNQEDLQTTLRSQGIEYHHVKGLGGHRQPVENSLNTGWSNESFRGYADYAQTGEFETNFRLLMEVAEVRVTTVMCAEIVPWRCHRSIIADYLLVRGWDVVDIIDEGHARKHRLTSFAKIVNGKSLIYPSGMSRLD